MFRAKSDEFAFPRCCGRQGAVSRVRVRIFLVNSTAQDCGPKSSFVLPFGTEDSENSKLQINRLMRLHTEADCGHLLAGCGCLIEASSGRKALQITPPPLVLFPSLSPVLLCTGSLNYSWADVIVNLISGLTVAQGQHVMSVFRAFQTGQFKFH